MGSVTVPLASRLPVLTYHSLDDSGSPISIAPHQFRWQMQRLQADGWRTLTLDELLAGHARGAWPSRTFALTFDDGFENFAEHALSVLGDCGFSATLFIVADWVGRTNDWPGQVSWVPRWPLLTWDRLCAISQAGVEIGGHSLSHVSLTRIPLDVAQREIVDCRRVLEDRIGHPARSFAYPYGESSEQLRRIVAANFDAGFGTRLGFATAGSSAVSLDRIDMYYLRAPFLFRSLEAGWLDAYLGLRRWGRDARRVERKVMPW